MCQVLHWANATQVFREAYRVLKSNSFVVIYEDYFLWHADEETPFMKWFRASFQSRFPQPPRNRQSLNAQGEFAPTGFGFAGYEEYSHPESLTLDQLIEHLITQSTVVSAVDQGGESLGHAVQWLQNELQIFFGATPQLTFPFGGDVYYLRRA